ncbi:MAG: hypothetical protein AB7L41_06155 [Flavobacteriaceae bacterium]
MKAKVTKEFHGVPDKQVHPVAFKEGDEVNGDLAATAVNNGWAKKIDEKPAAAEKPAKEKK